MAAAPKVAKQGYRYRHNGWQVMALEYGEEVRVGVMEEGQPWFMGYYTAKACELEPMPMGYFHGEIPT